jgi:hypothetical protein
MKTTKHILLFLLLCTVFVGASKAITYMWFTDQELTVYGERIKFFSGDTLDGPVRSNDVIAIMGDPVFLDIVITSADDFWRGAGYAPTFLNQDPIFNAPRLELPRWPESVRNVAVQQGNYFAWSGYTAKIIFNRRVAVVYRWPQGTPFDSTDVQLLPVADGTCLFFDCALSVKGIVEGRISVGSSQQLYIEDDIRYLDADLNTGATPTTSTNLLALVAGDDIKIANTPENGRWNSGGRGVNQTNRDSTSVVITALLFAGHSFTFEQQNDPDSGYVFDGAPDDRGTVYVYGGIYQGRRGYAHRANRSSTGYLKRYRFDQRLRTSMPPGLYDPEILPEGCTDTLDFGDVTVGTTAWDTAQVYTYFSGPLGSVYATYPFYATRTPPFDGTHFSIPVRFTPPNLGRYSGYLSIATTEHYFQIPVFGRGVPQADSLTVCIAPNPFNLTTTIRYALTSPSAVKITLYDILGRIVKQIDEQQQTTGEHAVRLDAAGLASGVYFVRTEAAGKFVTQKILLLK